MKPTRPRRVVPGHEINEMLRSHPPDETLTDDIRRAGGGVVDPFE